MRSTDSKAARFQQLREKAERALESAPPQLATTTRDVRRLLHELSVLHIELEMQHEELLDAQRGMEVSRDSYVRLFDFAPVGYVVLDRMGLILDLNLSAADLLGGRRDHLVKKPFMTYVHSASQQIFFRHRSNVFEEGLPQRCELELALRHGGRAVVKMQSHLLPGADTDAGSCLSALMDITEHKELQEALDAARRVLTERVDERTAALVRANQELERARKELEARVRQRTAELEQANAELRESDARQRILFQTIPDSITLATLDEGRFVDCNEGFCALSGFSRDEVLGRTALELNIWPVAQQRAEFVRLLEQQGHLHNQQVEFLRKDGSRIRALVSARLVELHETRHILSVTRDIGDLKRAEEKFRNIFLNSNLGIFRSSMQGRMLDLNPALAHMLGYAGPEEFLALVRDIPRDMYVDPARRREVLAALREAPEGATFEVDFKRKDGSAVTCRLHARTVQDPGAPETLLEGFLEDISEHKRNEEALRAAKERADAASRSKSAFLANMSHELRTPLGNILGMTDLTLTTPLQEDQRKYVGLIKESAHSLLHIINDLLDISRIEAGKLQLEQRPFAPGPLLESTLAQFGKQAMEKGLGLELELDPALPSQVGGDPERLGQVLRNLVANAIKFTEQGEVILRGRFLTRDGARIRLMFSVQDTGPGIAEADRPRLFKSFSQLENSLSRKVPGAGLGLAISKELVEMMGGSIWVKSEPGQGAVFSFSIAVQQAADTPSRARAAAPGVRTCAPLRIVLAEDNPVNAEFVSHFLGQAGHTVLRARSGREALKLWRDEPVDLVLMDIQMQDMDGLEATQAIRRAEQEQGRRPVPIAALTAYAMDADKDRFLQAGMDACLTKPVDVDALLDCVAGLARSAAREAEHGGESAPSSGGLQHFDEARALRMVKGSQEIVLLLRQKFVFEAAPTLLDKLRAALDAGQVGPLREAAHSLKGSAATVCAPLALELATRLEELARNGDLVFAGPLLAALAQELAVLEQLVPRPDGVVDEGC